MNKEHALKPGFYVIILTILVLLGLTFPVLPVRAEEVTAASDSYTPSYADDGTLIGNSQGASLMGLPTGRSSESIARGDTPAMGYGNTFGIVPLELLAIEGDTLSYSDQDYSLGRKSLALSNTSTGVTAYKNYGKSISMDVDADGKDELVYLYLKDAGNSKLTLAMAVYTYKGKCIMNTTLPGSFDVSDIDALNKNTHDTGKYNTVFVVDNIFQVVTGDFNGDFKDELAYVGYDKADGKLKADIHVLEYTGGDYSKVDINADGFSLSLNEATLSGGRSFVSSAFAPIKLSTGDINTDCKDEILYTYVADNADSKNADNGGSLGYIRTDGKGYQATDCGAITLGPDGSANRDPVGFASATVGDINADGEMETVIGGYMVNFDNQSHTDNNGTKYYHQLVLASLRWDHNANKLITDTSTGFTVLRSDDGTAINENTSFGSKMMATIFPESSKKASLPADQENYWCVSPQSSAWNAPLQAVSLSGNKNNLRCHQIYFCGFIYTLGQEASSTGTAISKFKVYRDTKLSTLDCQENNKTITLSTGITTTDKINQNELLGKEELFVSAIRDGNSGTSISADSPTHYNTFCYTELDKSGKVQDKLEQKGISLGDHKRSEQYVPHYTLGNVDNDTIYMKYIGHEFVYTEPKILSILMAPPYFKDLGNASSGSAAIGAISGTTHEFGGTFSATYAGSETVSIGIGSLAGGSMKISQDSTTSYTHKTTTVKELTFTYTTQSGQDSVCMAAVPTDIYYYNYCTLKDNQKLSDADVDWQPTQAIDPGTSVQTMLSHNLYNANKEKYNAFVKDYNAQNKGKAGYSELTEMPDVDKYFAHTPGEPDTYKYAANRTDIYQPTDLLALDYGTTSKSILYTTKVTTTEAGEEAFSIGFSFTGEGGLILKVKTEQGFKLGGKIFGSDGKTTGQSYKAEIKSIDEKYVGKYAFSTKMLINKGTARELNEKGEYGDYTFPILTYAVQDSGFKALPKKAENGKAEAASAHEMAVSWYMPKTTSTAYTPSHYELLRKKTTDPDTAWVSLENVATGGNELPEAKRTFTYTDKGLEANTAYTYKVVSKRTGTTETTTNEITFAGTTSVLPKFPVTYNDGDHGTVIGGCITDGIIHEFAREDGKTTNTAKVTEGDGAYFNALPVSGYRITGWTVDGLAEGEYQYNATTGKLTIPKVTKAFTVTPVWAKATTNLTLQAGEGGTLKASWTDPADGETRTDITVDSGTVAIPVGASVALTAVPDEGKALTQWHYGSDSSNALPPPVQTLRQLDGKADFTGTEINFTKAGKNLTLKAGFEDGTISSQAAAAAGGLTLVGQTEGVTPAAELATWKTGIGQIALTWVWDQPVHFILRQNNLTGPQDGTTDYYAILTSQDTDPTQWDWKAFPDEGLTIDNETTAADAIHLAVKRVGADGNTIATILTGSLVFDLTKPEVTVDYAKSNQWTDQDLDATIQLSRLQGFSQLDYLLNGERASLTSLNGQNGLTTQSGALQSAADNSRILTIDGEDMKDGEYHLLPRVYDNYDESTINRPMVMVKKDSVTPALKLSQVAGIAETDRCLVITPTVGASGIAEMKISGDDGTSWTDITGTWNQGIQISKGSRYQVRMTNGAGITVTQAITIQIPDTPKPTPVNPDSPSSPTGSATPAAAVTTNQPANAPTGIQGNSTGIILAILLSLAGAGIWISYRRQTK